MAAAIGPHFAGLPQAEAKAAIAMMAERGHTVDQMAAHCGCSPADLDRIARSAPGPVRAPGWADIEPSKSSAQAEGRPHAPADLDRALRLIAAYAAAGGAALDERFLMTLGDLSALLEGSIRLARGRACALVAAGLIDWHMLAGQPGSMLILAPGRLRLEKMGFSPASAVLPAAWEERRSARKAARGRTSEKAVEVKALRMLLVLDLLRIEAGVGPACGFAASMATITRASGLIDKTARNHLDLVIRQGWVDRDASAGRCATLTITAAGRAVLDASAAKTDAPETGTESGGVV